MAVTGLDRSDRFTRPVAPEAPDKGSLPDYPGEYPEYPCIAQSIRAKIQTIRELTMKKS